MGLFSFLKKKHIPVEERRQNPRLRRIFIAQCEAGELKSYSTVCNISRTGLGVFLERPMEIGSEFSITLQHEFIDGAYDSQQINLVLPVRVIWVKEIAPEEKEFPGLEEKQYRAGLELLALPPDIEVSFNSLLQKIEMRENKE